MKRLFSAFLAALLLLSACASSPVSNPTVETPPPATAQPTPGPTPEPTPEPAPESTPKPTPEPEHITLLNITDESAYVFSNSLSPGMSYWEVISIMGQPDYIISYGRTLETHVLYSYQLFYIDKAVLTLDHLFERDWRTLPDPGTQIAYSSHLQSARLGIVQLCGGDIATSAGIACGDKAQALFDAYGFTDSSPREAGSHAWVHLGMYFDPEFNAPILEQYDGACCIQNPDAYAYELPSASCIFFFLTGDTVSGITALDSSQISTWRVLADTSHEPIDFCESPVIPTGSPIAAVTYSAFIDHNEGYDEKYRSEYDGSYDWYKTILLPDTAKSLLELMSTAEFTEYGSFDTGKTYSTFEIIYTDGQTASFFYAKDDASGEMRLFMSLGGGFMAQCEGLDEFIDEYLE